MIKLKDNHLTKVSLFKNNFFKSWAYLPKTGQVVIHDEDTAATNWTIYKGMNWMRGKAGTGYTVDFYKKGEGIKGAKVAAPGVALVKVKNKPNQIKAVQHLGKYSQHKPLLEEVIKTLDFIDELENERKE